MYIYTLKHYIVHPQSETLGWICGMPWRPTFRSWGFAVVQVLDHHLQGCFDSWGWHSVGVPSQRGSWEIICCLFFSFLFFFWDHLKGGIISLVSFLLKKSIHRHEVEQNVGWIRVLESKSALGFFPHFRWNFLKSQWEIVNFISIVLVKSPWGQSFPGGLKRISGVQDNHFLTSGAGESAGQLQGARFETFLKNLMLPWLEMLIFQVQKLSKAQRLSPIFFLQLGLFFFILGPINNMSEHLRTMFLGPKI